MFKFFSCLTGVAVILLGFVKNCDAQCGTLASSCTSLSDTICDLSPNDPLLWSGSPWYDPSDLILEKVVPGALPGMDDDAFGLSQGRVAASWYSARAEAVRPETPLFSLRVKALRGVNIRDALRLETGRLIPEIYTAAGARRPLLPVFKAADADMGDLAVFDAQPNPTAGAATIPLTLAGPAEGHLLVTDASGKPPFRRLFPAPPVFKPLTFPPEPCPKPGFIFGD